MSKVADAALAEYAKEKLESLSPELQTLIEMANHDLYYGPLYPDEADNLFGDEVKWPGFSAAVDRISDALDDIRDVWIDDGGYVSESEPEGFMDENPDYDPDGPDDDDENPEKVWVEPEWQEIAHRNRRSVLAAMVGKELAGHL